MEKVEDITRNYRDYRIVRTQMGRFRSGKSSLLRTVHLAIIVSATKTPLHLQPNNKSESKKAKLIPVGRIKFLRCYEEHPLPSSPDKAHKFHNNTK